MHKARWERAKQIFLGALEKNEPERGGFVAAACADDPELLAHVSALLQAHDDADGFLASPTVPEVDEVIGDVARLSEVGLPESPGATIGCYKLLQVIGEGGFGVVYMAEQEEPMRRLVALKVIKLGMDTMQVIARFEAERQALALMEHPNIARVLDAGATETGRPYFVMELVKGVPITTYCDANRLTTRARLNLFTDVCSAVQHAHQKGIVHRDLKPSNVLVTLHDGKPVPKVIDFGIAKATQQRLTEKTLFTAYGQYVGTPVYMSPEQAEMSELDVDTRSDVYSLGVLLYELLTGTTPFALEALREKGFAEIQRIIREEEPPKPSTRLSTLGGKLSHVAEHRRADPNSLSRLVRGDLDWITLKALEKDRTRRYVSPNELAADIRRHLQHEPVLASPPSATYRMRKFVRRNRFGVALAGVVLLMLLLGLAGTTHGLIRATRAEATARQEAATAEQVSEFLEGMLGDLESQALGAALWRDLRVRVAQARRGRGADEQEIEAVLASLSELLSGVNPTDTAVHLLDGQILLSSAQRIEQELAREPRIAGRLERTLGRTYQTLGLLKQAVLHLERAVQIQEKTLGPSHPETLSSSTALGEVYWVDGREVEAESLLRETAEARRRVLGEEHPDTLWTRTHLGWAYIRLHRFEDAEKILYETMRSQRRLLGEEHLHTLTSMNALAGVYWYQDRLAEAETLQRETLETTCRVLGEEHTKTLSYKNTLAMILSARGRYLEAEKFAREVLTTRRRMLGAEHPSTIAVTGTLAFNLMLQSRYAEAETLCSETLVIARRSMGGDHPFARMVSNNLGLALEGQGRYVEAERLFLEMLETEQRVLGSDHSATRETIYELGFLKMLQDDREAALDWFTRAIESGFSKDDWASIMQDHRVVLGEDHPVPRRCLYHLGVAAARSGDREAALDWLDHAVVHGFSRVDWMSGDSDLDPLRNHPRFEGLSERARQNAAAQAGQR